MNIAVSGLLGLIAIVFFVAERSLSLFSWSQLEELTISRSARQAVEKCLEEHELAGTCFLVIGAAAATAAATLSAFVTAPAPDALTAVLRAVMLAVLVIWVVPELIAWKWNEKIVMRLVPPLYRLTGAPFRLLRALLVTPASHMNGALANTEGDISPAPSEADAEAHEFFKMAVRIQHMPVREIMTPRTDMVGIPATATLRKAAEVCRQSGYSRFPVYRRTRDQIIGVLLIKDLLAYAGTEKWDEAGLEKLLRKPFFTPETKTISELLEEFQRTSTHMGIVLDEYGGTSGLVTLEDILEELVGEIHDEFESAEREVPLFTWTGNRSVELMAVMHVEQFNEEFGLDLPEEEDFDTVGGFVTFILGKIPNQGDSFEFGGARFTVLEADPRRVVRLRLDLARETPAREKV